MQLHYIMMHELLAIYIWLPSYTHVCNLANQLCSYIPYGGKLWRVQTLVEWQGKHHWRNKLWRIDDKSLIKRILKQFEYKSTHNWSIRVHMFANAD